MAPYKVTYTGPGYTYVLTYPGSNTYTYNPYNPYGSDSFTDAANTALAVWGIAVAVIIGLHVLALIVVAIVYFQRQKKRKAWYGPMAAHYRNGGLPPWAAGGGGSVKAPLLSNDYNSGVTYPPTNSDPKAQYEPPSQFGVYGNVPPSNTHTTTPYSHTTGMTGYTRASYHTATSVPPTPPPQSFSPQPQTIGGHSQYASTTGSFEPYAAPQVSYNAPPNAYTPPPGAYAPPAAAPAQYHYGSAPTSPAPEIKSPHSAVPAYESPTHGGGPEYEYAGASGSHLPAYAGAGAGAGAFAQEYPKEKGWEYTNPPVGAPPKQ